MYQGHYLQHRVEEAGFFYVLEGAIVGEVLGMIFHAGTDSE
jgi:hypothetical protein